MGEANLVYTKGTNKIHLVAQNFSEARSALEGVFYYYKVGRYGTGHPGKPYFLLSCCAHVSFSLWLAEQESETSFFGSTSRPVVYQLGLDFGQLRYSEFKRRVLHTHSLEDHITNETKWFEFWMRLLEKLDPPGAPAYQEFTRRVLLAVGHPSFLDEPVCDQNTEALERFLQTDNMGRILVRTMSLLEDYLRATANFFTTAEARLHVLDQTALITGLLREMRRTVIWETPARGPYHLSSQTRWGAPASLLRLPDKQAKGFLRVVPKRDGGEMICTFHPADDKDGRDTSWRGSLSDAYEQELFAVWSYGSGAPRKDVGQSPDCKASWTLQEAEVGRLESMAKQIDGLLAVIPHDPQYQRLAAMVRDVSRKDGCRWKAEILPWTYVKRLDQLVTKLTFIYREAKALGGDMAVPSVIARV